MAITTPNDLIKLVLKDSGVVAVGQTPDAEDINDSFNRLNMMLAQWNRKRWLVWQLVDTAFTSTGATSYTVAVGGNFNVDRPDRIESGFFRFLNGGLPVDYPMTILQAREDYNRIMLKTLTAFPQYAFYDSAYPTGLLYPWPVIASGQFQIHISTKKVIQQFATLSDSLNLPPEYYALIYYNLCVRTRVAYQMPPDEALNGLARDSLAVVRGANVQIARLKMPDALQGRGAYDVYSDQVR